MKTLMKQIKGPAKLKYFRNQGYRDPIGSRYPFPPKKR